MYLSATPRFQFVGFVPVACLLLAAYTVRRGLRFVCRPMEPRTDRVGGSRGGGAVLDHPGGLGDGVRR